jgi:hypothetical protein
LLLNSPLNLLDFEVRFTNKKEPQGLRNPTNVRSRRLGALAPIQTKHACPIRMVRDLVAAVTGRKVNKSSQARKAETARHQHSPCNFMILAIEHHI